VLSDWVKHDGEWLTTNNRIKAYSHKFMPSEAIDTSFAAKKKAQKPDVANPIQNSFSPHQTTSHNHHSPVSTT
jgi:hypothetical protein